MPLCLYCFLHKNRAFHFPGCCHCLHTLRTNSMLPYFEPGVEPCYQHPLLKFSLESKCKDESSVYQIRSVAQSCPTLCDPMNRSTPGLPVHHQLPEFTQTHVHRVSEAVQPSHPLSSPSPPASNTSKHQSVFQ